MFRGTFNDIAAVTNKAVEEEIVMGSNPVQLDFVCQCGAQRFKWEATVGRIRVGGFQPDEYIYKCIGCGKEYNENDVKQFFSKQR